ncbi:pilus assembly protein [Vibrio sp. ZSDZ65]|uniref:Pilus assembly protein n=1 Tax=Vibrio qingdaonensis TaxID=2829491 RepID=A0A9X3HUI6_9VIBR|nr:TadE family protein [Vibrio qingdaonensis]MCW8344510.1 pilus assembly protein [Vibrio qingdaonensis]
MYANKLRQTGVTTIEFSIGAIVLILTTLMIFEASYHIYVNNLVDYALRETVRNTQFFAGESTHTNYQSRINNLVTNDGHLWSFMAPHENFTLTGRYFNSYSEFVNNTGLSETHDDFTGQYTLAELTLSYEYTPIINLFGNEPHTISRTTVLNLEHEGWGE